MSNIPKVHRVRRSANIMKASDTQVDADNCGFIKVIELIYYRVDDPILECNGH